LASGGVEQQVLGVLQRRDQAVRQALEGLTLRALASEPTLFQGSQFPRGLYRETDAIQSERER
jgi:hypothetical protein